MSNRSTVYNQITSKEKILKINQENKSLIDDFLDYLQSIGRSQTTIKNYRADLNIFFCWCLDELENKPFVNITKREIVRFQNHALNTWGWSPNRVRTVKSSLSSLGNFIETILDDEYKGFRSIVTKVESPPKRMVREKTVWKDEELDHLMKELVKMGALDKACFVALAVYSGRRKSELCRFKLSDFNEDRLICSGALYKSAPIKTKGRGGGKYIPCYTLAKKFKPYLELWLDSRQKIGIESEWLFPNKNNPSEPMSVTTVDGWCESFSKITGKEFYMHSLRHAYTTSLSKSGMPDSVIQALVGWENADMVRLYDDTPKDDQIGAYFKNGDIIVKSEASITDV